MGQGKINLKIIAEKISDLLSEANTIISENIDVISFYRKRGKTNFVSDIDYLIEKLLIENLSKIIPNSDIISEEGVNRVLNPEKFTWIIDPIDGTTNLIHNYPYFSISIALIKDNKVLIGQVYNPVTNELFHAIRGQGAFLNKSKICVSDVKKMKDSLFGFGFPYDERKRDSIFKLLRSMIDEVHELRRTGSSALDLAYLACGRIDVFFEFDLEIWDYTAASLLITEAGGTISSWNHKGLYHISKTNIIATNKHLSDELVSLIKP